MVTQTPFEPSSTGAPRRATILGAVLVGVLLSAASVSGCGSAGPKVASIKPAPAGRMTSTSSSSGELALRSTGHRAASPDSRVKAAYVYAACLRGHGLSDYPDPQSEHHGLLEYVPYPNTGSGLPLDAPQVIKAARACARERAEVFGPPSEAELAAIRRQAEAVAVCMRAHGFPAYPLAVINDMGVQSLVIPKKVARQPGFAAADQRCEASASSSSSS